MIKAGKIIDSKTICAVMIYAAKKKLEEKQRFTAAHNRPSHHVPGYVQPRVQPPQKKNFVPKSSPYPYYPGTSPFNIFGG